MLSLTRFLEVYKINENKEMFSNRELEKMVKENTLYTVKKAVGGDLQDDETYGYIVKDGKATSKLDIVFSILEKVNLQLGEVRLENAELKKRVNELEEKNTNLTKRVNELTQENTNLTKRVNELEEKNAKLTQENTNLTKRVNKLEEENTNLTQENTNLTKRVNKLEDNDLLVKRANTLKEVFKYLANKVSSEKELSTYTDSTKPSWYNIIESLLRTNIVFEICPISLNALRDLWDLYKALRLSRNTICHMTMETSVILVSDDETTVVQWYFEKIKEK